MSDFSSKRVVVMGLGRFGGGVGVSRFLASRGARVLVTDQAPADELQASMARLAGLPITYRLGEHRMEDFTAADLIVVNPAVDQRDNTYLQAAKAAGVAMTSEIRLLIEHLPDRGRRRTIGVTGTAGKSTTTAMIGHILAKQLHAGRLAGAGGRAVHVGGNLGGSLLEKLDTIGRDDWVVLELSSFMLQDMAADRWSPHVAVITNLSPNHLDRHGNLEAYAHAKQVILEHQGPGDHAILGAIPRGFFRPRTTNLHWSELWDNMTSKAPVTLLIPGEHNIFNANMAIEAALCAGVDRHEAAAAVADFPGLPHRLQFVCTFGGDAVSGGSGDSGGSGGSVRFFNDSKATTPEATELALRSFPGDSVHVILGGYDKGSDLAPLARFAAGHCRAIYTIGATGETIAAAAQSPVMDSGAVHGPNQDVATCGGSPGWTEGRRAEVVRCETLDRAVTEAVRRVRYGDVVLLSPGCASWDQFDNFEQRGAAFVEAILKYTGEAAPPPKPR